MTQAARKMLKPAWQELALESPATLRGAGQFLMRHAMASRTLRPSTWLLEVIVMGVLEVDVADTGWRRFPPRTGVLYAPGTRYRERSPQGQDSRSLCVFFDLGSDPLLAPLRDMDPPFALLDDRHDRFSPLLLGVVEDSSEPGPRRLAAMGGLLHLLALLLSAERREPFWCIGEPATGDDDLLAATRAFLRANLHRPLRVADLARRSGLTASGFAHAYRRAAGCSPMQDLRRMRVDAVKTHLLRHRLTLSQIAEQTGFADGFHLSHVFRQVTGLSPRQFRDQGQSLPSGRAGRVLRPGR